VIYGELLIDVILRTIGAFYAFAGLAGARAAVMDAFFDYALAAIVAAKPPPKTKQIWMLAGALAVLAGGAALLLGLEIAFWLFLTASLGQALYLLVVAPRWFDPDDPPDEEGRQRSWNSFVLFAAVTALVGWAMYTDRLSTLSEANPILVGVAGAAVVGVAVQRGRQLASPRRRKGSEARTSATESEPAPTIVMGDPSQSTRIMLAADWHCQPLWGKDFDKLGNIDPNNLPLTEGLIRDLEAWRDAFMASYNVDDPGNSLWSDEQHRRHAELAIPLAKRLAAELPDRTIIVLKEGGDEEIITS